MKTKTNVEEDKMKINLWLLPRHNALHSEALRFGSVDLVDVENIPKEGEYLPLAFDNGGKRPKLEAKFMVREVVENKGTYDVYFYVEH